MADDPRPHEESGGIRFAADGQAAPVRSRELLAVLGLVVLADLTIYRGYGFAGMAALFVAAPLLLLWGAPQRRVSIDLAIVATMLVLLAAALTWCGVGGQIAVGALLVVAFAMILSGMRPFIVDLLAYACVTLAAGGAGISKYLQTFNRISVLIPRATWIKVVLPLAAVLCFGTIFVSANPNEAKTVGQWLSQAWNSVWQTFVAVSPTGPEYLLWAAVAWVAAGLLRPLVRYSVFGKQWPDHSGVDARTAPESEAPLFAAFRNTLIAVIVLFAAYLVFEFTTLWFRVFPKGFYYSGYAHEGAAWLTAALVLATVMLSAIFRSCVLCDPRLPRLRKLAWLWSVENLLLAVAVYHRMHIYVGFNGMTRMRVVGLLGMTAVLVEVKTELIAPTTTT